MPTRTVASTRRTSMRCSSPVMLTRTVSSAPRSWPRSVTQRSRGRDPRPPRRPDAPCLVPFQRSLEDALELQKITGQPLLICVNMDGEPASERLAWGDYRDERFAKLASGFICVIASPDRSEPSSTTTIAVGVSSIRPIRARDRGRAHRDRAASSSNATSAAAASRRGTSVCRRTGRCSSTSSWSATSRSSTRPSRSTASRMRPSRRRANSPCARTTAQP